MKNNINFFIISHSVLPRMTNFQKKVVDEIKTHILHSVTFFFLNHAIYEIM